MVDMAGSRPPTPRPTFTHYKKELRGNFEINRSRNDINIVPDFENGQGLERFENILIEDMEEDVNLRKSGVCCFCCRSRKCGPRTAKKFRNDQFVWMDVAEGRHAYLILMLRSGLLLYHPYLGDRYCIDEANFFLRATESRTFSEVELFGIPDKHHFTSGCIHEKITP